MIDDHLIMIGDPMSTHDLLTTRDLMTTDLPEDSRPVAEVGTRDVDAAARSRTEIDFRSSFLKTRLVVGVVGIMLPIGVVVGDRLLGGHGQPTLSDYYYSVMRNWFVGSLWAIGTGLLVYLAVRRNRLDSVISFVAGLLAIGVALFPTSHLPSVPSSAISTVHLVCAGTLFTLLAIMSIRFGWRDGQRDDRTDRWRHVWRAVHIGCGVIIIAAIAVSVLVSTMIGDESGSNVVLIGESVAVIAFGVSWFLKGSELFNLIREAADKPARFRA